MFFVVRGLETETWRVHLLFTGSIFDASIICVKVKYELQVTSSNPRVRKLKARLARLKARVGWLNSKHTS